MRGHRGDNVASVGSSRMWRLRMWRLIIMFCCDHNMYMYVCMYIYIYIYCFYCAQGQPGRRAQPGRRGRRGAGGRGRRQHSIA